MKYRKHRIFFSVLIGLLVAISGFQPLEVEAAAARTSTSGKQTTKKKQRAVAQKTAKTSKAGKTAKTTKATKATKTTAAKKRKAGKATSRRVSVPSRRAYARNRAPQSVSVQTNASGDLILSGVGAYAVASQRTGQIIAGHRTSSTMPIASITKLMTAMVVLDAQQSLDEILSIEDEDIDRLKGSSSRLPVGTRLSRRDMLHLALMSSENRAASALARYYPGGRKAFVSAMNVKARLIGLTNTRFVDSTGLNPGNTSSPSDLVKMVRAGAGYDVIRNFSTDPGRYMRIGSRLMHYRNTNGLVREGEWSVELSKTGYIREAGHCVVMQTRIRGEPVIIVLMDAGSSGTRTVEARRVKHWLETTEGGRQRLLAMAQPVVR